MITKIFIFMIWAVSAQSLISEKPDAGALVSTQSWKSVSECQVAANQTMQTMTAALIAQGMEPPLLMGQCIEYTPGSDA